MDAHTVDLRPHLFDGTRSDVVRLLAEHRPAIERVADLLSKRGMLTADDLEAILGAQRPSWRTARVNR